MYKKFFRCFEPTGEAMDTVVMKNIFATIRDTLLTVGIWILVPVERKGDGQKHACLTPFESP